MKKKIIMIAVISLGVILAVLALRLAAGRSTAVKNQTPIRQPAAAEAPNKKSHVLTEAGLLLDRGERALAIKKLEAAVSAYKGSQQAYESLMALADIYKEDGNYIKAKGDYMSAAGEYSQYCNYADIQKRLSELNIAILFSKIPTPDSEIYTVLPGDSLVKIAKDYSTTVELIKRANGLKTDTIMPGQKLKVQNAPFSIIVDKSQSTLTLISNDEVIKTYIVSTGKNSSTPSGRFKIKDKLIDPTWYSTTAVIPPGNPDNILGSRWMGLTTPQPGFGIHGTSSPETIGYQCTEGCVRMRNAEVEELFTIIPVGTEVTIID